MAAFLLSITRSRIDVPGCQPTCFHGISALTIRQNLSVLDRSEYSSAEGLHRGGYILWENGENGASKLNLIYLIRIMN
jgi:hypothetical protein